MGGFGIIMKKEVEVRIALLMQNQESISKGKKNYGKMAKITAL
jgi:hypothetical protein